MDNQFYPQDGRSHAYVGDGLSFWGFGGSGYVTDLAKAQVFTKTQQVHMCGNSVSPPPMAALARANDPWRTEQRQAHAA